MPENATREVLNKERTEEVTHIIERMPTRFSFYVSIIILGLALVLFAFGWFIKYSEVLTGQITVTMRQSPVRLTSANAGRIHLLHENGATIKVDEYIAVLHNAAETKDVVLVDSLLKEINIHTPDYETTRKFFPENISLGEMNNIYFTFLNNLYQYLDYYHEKLFDKQKDILQKLTVSLKQAYNELGNEYERLKNKYSLATRSHKRDSILYAEKVIAASEFEKSKMSLINSEQEFKSLNIQLANNKYGIEDADNKIQQLIIQHFEKERQLHLDLLNSYFEMQESIRQWEHKYVFISPFSGKIEYLNFWKDGDYVQTGQEIFTMMPEQSSIVGQVLLPEQGAGKVRIGQEAIVKLDNYPYAEYGSIQGIVKRISTITNQQSGANQLKINTYLVTLEFPHGLKTNFGSQLDFHFEAKGTAEIITQKRKLIERLFDNLKHGTN
jgi:hypothetical protein